MRDDFAVEIWRDLGTTGKPSIFASTELMVTIVVLAISGAPFLIQSNRRAFFGSLATMWICFVATIALVLLRRSGALGPFAFMVLSGAAVYVPYVSFHTTVFERLLAVRRERANIGYLMYLADAFG